ncbi:SIR2 family protein [Clostridium sp. YIM B02555]|uniref:SIR2 family protein n=1 Tax=Clostridium sp. YIM B02555 TaxID=2911968 RepID=UPI001EED98E6|nr:SIR2 family protein [Clostridium sp. YIM B02555]
MNNELPQIDQEEIEELKTTLMSSVPTLFLGAGFSIGAKGEVDALDGKGLNQYIFDTLIKDELDKSDYEEVSNYNLRRMCEEVYSIYGGKTELRTLLTECFKNIRPGSDKFHLKFTNYPWKKIYTVNVDDLVEHIYKMNGIELQVQNKKQFIITEGKAELYKLHGCVNRPDEGYVFSESEYLGLTTSILDAKINNFSIAMQQEDIIFIGASMDEPDIQYYLKKYEDAGCKYRKNKLFFIDPKPSRYLRSRAKELEAKIIQWTTKDFIEFVTKINFKPNEIEKAKITLNYNGIIRLADLKKTYVKPYESSIYEGYYCKWQDIYEEWTFEETNYKRAINELEKLLNLGNNINCFSIYGTVLSGKSCLLKQLGYYLDNKEYDVLEYRGRFLSRNSIIEYINKSPYTKFALLVDGGSYYYEEIEKLFSAKINDKKLVILTASREYYHHKKKYYLEGNSYIEFKQNDIFVKDDAVLIAKKLEEKSHLGYMTSYSNSDAIIHNILKLKSMVNLIVDLTYGEGMRRKVFNNVKIINKLSEEERRLLTELAIFDIADVDSYPRELFTEQYGNRVKADAEIDTSTKKIVDYVRMDADGLTLRNCLLNEYILKKEKSNIPKILIDMLIYVSRFVREKRNDTWYIIFQCLSKEEVLHNKFKLNNIDIGNIYYSIKEQYKNISYYWLQLGLYEQKNGHFSKAYNHLEISSKIRPNSFKIQHAIARNYLIYANSTNDYTKALSLFLQGEEKIKELINSKEYYKEKAKKFSVNCYILEKIKFINKFKIEASIEDLHYMNNILMSITPANNDSYYENVLGAFYKLLEKQDKLSILKMDFSSPYLIFVNNNFRVDLEVNDKDPVIEAL